MNRRSAIQCVLAFPMILKSAPVRAEETWVILGRRVVGPNLRSISFSISSEVAGISKLGIELKGNSIWLYNLRVVGLEGGSTVYPVNFNIPPKSGICSPNLNVLTRGEWLRHVELDFECLPLTGKSTEILLWGAS